MVFQIIIYTFQVIITQEQKTVRGFIRQKKAKSTPFYFT